MLLSILLQSYGRYDYHEPSWLDGAFSAWYWDLGNWFFIAIALTIVHALIIKFWRWFSGADEIERAKEREEWVKKVMRDEEIARMRREREWKKMWEERKRFMEDEKRSVEEKDAFLEEWWKRERELSSQKVKRPL